MSSQLQQLAAAVRGLADDTGQPMQVLARLEQRAQQLAAQADALGDDAKSVLNPLYEMKMSLGGVFVAMNMLRSDAERFAAFLAQGGSGTPSQSIGLSDGAVSDWGGGVHTLPGLPPGCVMVPIDLIDQTENPINGPQDFGKGYSIEDLDHAFQLFESEILPGLAGGADASSFSDRDHASGTYGVRSLADTFSGFLGDSAIKLERRPDGTFAISNGRHRIYVANIFGRKFVPAFLSGSRVRRVR